MDIRDMEYNCNVCGQIHIIQIDWNTLTDEQKSGRDSVMNYFCDKVARMYRVSNYAVNTINAILDNDINNLEIHRQKIINQLKRKWGESDIADKIDRFKKLNINFIGVPDESDKLMQEIVSCYCCEYYYPAMTGAGALGERILNRLILKTRQYFKGHEYYNQVKSKNSFANWDISIKALTKWGVISSEVAENFNKLNRFRNKTIHYENNFYFSANAAEMISCVSKIVDLQFNYCKRNDILHVFVVPGEIFVRSDKLYDAFVREFIIPNCINVTAYCVLRDGKVVSGNNAPLEPISDIDFLKARRNYFKKFVNESSNLL